MNLTVRIWFLLKSFDFVGNDKQQVLMNDFALPLIEPPQ